MIVNLGVISTTIGVIVADKKGAVVDAQAFPDDVEKTTSIFLDVKNGRDSDILDAIVKALNEKILSLQQDDLILDFDEDLLCRYFQKRLDVETRVIQTSSISNNFHEDPSLIPAQLRPNWTIKQYHEFNREINISLSKQQIKSVSGQNDKLIIQGINSIDDLDKSANIFSERIREWYGYHFPELTDKLVSDHKFFLELVTELGTRDNFDGEKLKEIRPIEERTASFILERAKESMGGDFSPYDVKVIQYFAKSVLELYNSRELIESYVEALMEQTCPNLSVILGPILGARLICLAGGLEALAKKPSSTVQMLGAEKALFRAIKTKGEPPKHGVIFQSSYIRTAPYWQRGKIARLLAGKISIAAKVDKITKRYIADDLLEEINEKIEEIQRKYPDKPPDKKKHHSKRSSYKKKQYNKRKGSSRHYQKGRRKR